VKRSILTLAIVILGSTGCTNVWAGGIARDVHAGLSSIKSYRGVTVETGLDDAPVERTIVFAKPWKVRVETTSPGPHAGELFVYDGDTITLWYPQQLFGVQIRGVHTPTDREVLHHIERLTKVNLNAYTFALQSGSSRVVGQKALQWLVRPARRAPFRFVHRVWNHESTTMPLAMEFLRDDKSPWYSFTFKELAFDVDVAPETFAVTFPRNAVVFEWDLGAPGMTLDDARAEMNFKVQVPTKLPAGHSIQKIVRSPHCLPMIVMVMDHDGTMLSLTESRYSGATVEPLGIDIMLGDTPAKLSFMGGFSSVSWVKDGALLSLTSNIEFPTLIDVAASVQ
jgi:outer membrane lipoprotein-sorting protein